MVLLIIIILLISSFRRNSSYSLNLINKFRNNNILQQISQSYSMDVNNLVIPEWYNNLLMKENRVIVPEWTDENWRNSEGGFSGVDFCHSPSASLRILDYFIIKNEEVENGDNKYKLIGAVHFTNKCESHRGLCHGGTFCAVMDDAIGWMGFCVTGTARPWTGFTVQINTSLKKPVKVGSILKVESWVARKESARKYWISSQLMDAVSGDIHCYAEGLFLMSPEEADRIELAK